MLPALLTPSIVLIASTRPRVEVARIQQRNRGHRFRLGVVVFHSSSQQEAFAGAAIGDTAK